MSVCVCVWVGGGGGRGGGETYAARCATDEYPRCMFLEK